MGNEDKVILHGMRVSPLTRRVELALRLKGVAFEYVEEDLRNKSPQLLQYNPVYKRVPVLVHNGKAIAESPIILEYIDETWKNNPHLLPEDAYRRAKVRFWTTFIQQELFQNMVTVIKTDGEVQEKAIKEVWMKLELLEEGLKEFFPDGNPSVCSESVGLLDVVLLTTFGNHKVEEGVLGFKIVDPEKTPLLFSWVTAINQLPLVKEFTTPHEKLVALLKSMRENALRSSSTQ